MVKKKLVFDKGGIKLDGVNVTNSVADRFVGGPKGTRIYVKNLDTGEVKELHNKTLISGAQWTATMQWGLDDIIPFPTYNSDMQLDTPAEITSQNTKKKISLFCCGTGGCGVEMSQVYDVDYTKRIQPSNMIPFRYQAIDNDLAPSMREVYFGRKTVGNSYYAYYFKKPETDPQMYAQYIDGTSIDANVFNSANRTEAELYVETVLLITKNDCRDYFIATTGINTALVNQFSLCQAWQVTDPDGYVWYQDILPVTQFNMNNESLIDLTKGIEITYQTYY
jgi:hypothetical protein